MPVYYENHYLTRPDWPVTGGSVAATLTAHGVTVGDGTVFCDVPRVAFTHATDLEAGVPAAGRRAFRGAITLGAGCYVESGVAPAFPSQPVKLSSIKVNDGPPGRIVVGDRVVLQGVAVVAYDLVEIGDDVIFGPMVTVMDSSGHPLRGRGEPGEAARTRSAPVRIGAGAWIGAGATILKGVEIGAGAVVGTQSVVHESVPAGAVVVGNPARVVKRL
ncbi:acetyltransferase-like isoleucine patch superfamily enzyme [Isoptericola jiangsuensis]|uniref:Acetyltransferase-like isoleucine patch superfamily enzyme n=1 Tax=Isoptericola jiangsuensis TaxID=548579 RepID=A0A2A9F360_9MICO|nr:acyltransferase [Isoptericola jiangsuensis]PFG44859.1 acetyltransferase-like isoleucine patch superfamily enzyme [Isoptericola jiangsuensis]